MPRWAAHSTGNVSLCLLCQLFGGLLLHRLSLAVTKSVHWQCNIIHAIKMPKSIKRYERRKLKCKLEQIGLCLMGRRCRTLWVYFSVMCQCWETRPMEFRICLGIYRKFNIFAIIRVSEVNKVKYFFF